MEPLGLALMQSPLKLGLIVFMLVAAGGVFVAAWWLDRRDDET